MRSFASVPNYHALSIYLEASAVIVSSLSGMIKAAEKRMDIVGTFSLALLVSFGGGTLRDVLLERRPFFWVENQEYLFMVLSICILFVYVPVFHRLAKLMLRRTNTIEAMGLALFTLTGLVAGLHAGLSYFPATLMGVITGVAGGVFRDIVINEIPVIFRPGGLYAVASFAGCWAFIGCHALAIPSVLTFPIAFFVIVALRLVSVFLGISLPDPFWMREKEK